MLRRLTSLRLQPAGDDFVALSPAPEPATDDDIIARLRAELPMHDPIIADSVERIAQRLA